MDPFGGGIVDGGYTGQGGLLDFVGVWLCSVLPMLLICGILVVGVALLYRLVQQTRRVADTLEQRQADTKPPPGEGGPA